jgi:hypothetical protein
MSNYIMYPFFFIVSDLRLYYMRNSFNLKVTEIAKAFKISKTTIDLSQK